MAEKVEVVGVGGGQGPQIQRREAWIELPDEYEGFRVKVWVNAPTKLWMTLQGGAEVEESARQGAAQKLVLAHNGWLDFDGAEYPAPSEVAFWEEIPTELAACLFIALQVEMQKLPNSMAPRKRRSKRG